MKQDAVSNVNELRKKMLKLCVTVDKQNDLIKKYQKALRIAGDDIVNTERYCAVCKSVYFCNKKSMTDLECKKTFIEGWKEKAGIE